MRFSVLVLFAAEAFARSRRFNPVFHSDTLIIDPPNSDDLQKRQVQGCDDTKALQNFVDARYSSSASDFCSSWLQTTTTSTQYNVVTALATTTIQPKKGATITTVNVIYTTKTTGTTTVTQVPTLFTQQVTTQQQLNKRDSNIPYPTWFSKSYAPAKVSSACSCVIPTPSPAVSVTVTVTTTTTLLQTVSVPTKTTIVTKSTTSLVKVAATQIVNCGIVGCSIGDYIINASQDYTTLAACKQYCLSVSTCLGYQFSTGTQTNCNIASVNASSLYSTYSYMFTQCTQSKLYDRNCAV